MSVRGQTLGVITAALFLSTFVGCGDDNGESPSATLTPTRTLPSLTPSSPPSPTVTQPRPSFTATGTATHTQPVSSPTHTRTVAPPSHTPAQTATPVSPTVTATAWATASASASETPSSTPTATPTFEPGTCFDPEVQGREPLCELDLHPQTCDFLVPEFCLYPYPSSFFLRADSSSPTGWRVNYAREAMPANARGVHIDPREWNTLDGFSPGAMMLALFPEGVDLAASNAPPITNYARSVEDDSPTVILDADTGERIIHFAEMDADGTSDANRSLILRPGVRLKERHRYIVALRGLLDSSGTLIQPRRAFQVFRDRIATPVRAIEERRDHFEDIFARLERAGIPRNNLQLAWDFVVASTESITGRMLAARDQALAANGPGAPEFEVTAIDENYSDRICRRVRGTYRVPLFLTSDRPPAVYNLDENGVPRQNGWARAPFTVIIPCSAINGEEPVPGRPMIYGHGLFGTGEGEVTAGPQQTLASRFGFIIAATDWIGMSNGDLDNTFRIIGDLSRFNQLVDRLQQSLINQILLGQLLLAEDGFVSHPAFQFGGVPIIDRRELFYHGNSQGAIEGAAFMAVAPNLTRGVLGVGAANYSFLLQRSIDFNPFFFVLAQAYPSVLNRAVLYALIQQLWDRGEPNGYTSHLIDDPLPNTPPKKVLIHTGINDSQVSHYATEIQVRSLGIPAVAPSAYPAFGIEERVAPFDGSAWVPYDVGGSPPPLDNRPPAFENGVHEAVRRLDAAQRQLDAFLRSDGRVENFCDGPCVFRDVPGVQ
ncbi:MAG: hypothetical protein N3C12_04060 [Candidatus Binatia bacterium]|nr:hypothetical protein [Candidatus Binatia bacterium]